MPTENDDAKFAELEQKISEISQQNQDLSRENAKWRRQAQGKDLPPEVQAKIEQLEEQNETFKTQLTEAQKTVKTAMKEAETFKKSLEGAESFTHKLLVDNGLNDALTKSGVTNPVHLKAAKSMLASQVAIVADGESRSAKIGDKDLAAAVSEWAKGDEGKFFVQATQNNGGGANGGDINSSKQTGNLGGSREERIKALDAKFPELTSKG
jgi:cell shape-determining protein MreC